MNKTIVLHGKPVQIELTPAAERALKKQTAPLLAEVHLIFGCMVAKRVWFKEVSSSDAVPVAPGLAILFRPVRYAKTCTFDDIDDGAIPEDYPLVRAKADFVPHAVQIDYRKGRWVGDFTYDREAYRFAHSVGD